MGYSCLGRFLTCSWPLGVQYNVYSLYSISLVMENFNNDAMAGNSIDYTMDVNADVVAGI